MIKFYPLAFLVAYKVESYEGLTSLHGYNQLPVYQKASIPVHLSPIREATWPEDINKSENVLFLSRSAQDAITSVPNIRRIKDA